MSGRAAWIAEWMTNAARLTGCEPYTTSPWWLTRMRSLTVMWRKLRPNGLTQKWSGNSGSRTVMWPATPSPKPKRPKMRSAPASFCLRWSRSSSTVSNVAGPSRPTALGVNGTPSIVGTSPSTGGASAPGADWSRMTGPWCTVTAAQSDRRGMRSACGRTLASCDEGYVDGSAGGDERDLHPPLGPGEGGNGDERGGGPVARRGRRRGRPSPDRAARRRRRRSSPTRRRSAPSRPRRGWRPGSPRPPRPAPRAPRAPSRPAPPARRRRCAAAGVGASLRTAWA